MTRKELSTDIGNILKENYTDDDLKALRDSIHAYMKSRNLDPKSTTDQVDLVLIIFSIMKVPESEFMEFVSRLNLIQLKRLGVLDSTSGGNVH